jgi:hypothetical protein
MLIFVALMLLAGAPFWETKAPDRWTVGELDQILQDSPWAKMLGYKTNIGNMPPVHVYLASAKPMQDAEKEMERRGRTKPSESPLIDEYREFLQENQGKYIILAVHLPDSNALADAKEAQRMEDECVLKIGRKKYKIVGHLPPTPSDPYLRLVFPRAVQPGDKKFLLELYLPSVPMPYRTVEFYVDDLLYKGKPEM